MSITVPGIEMVRYCSGATTRLLENCQFTSCQTLTRYIRSNCFTQKPTDIGNLRYRRLLLAGCKIGCRITHFHKELIEIKLLVHKDDLSPKQPPCQA
jgi:hypothetical protein